MPLLKHHLKHFRNIYEGNLSVLTFLWDSLITPPLKMMKFTCREVMCPGLPDESVTEQEIKPRSPGSTDTAQLCNHYTTYHSITSIARLVAVPTLRLFFPLAWMQMQQNIGSVFEWGECSGEQQALRCAGHWSGSGLPWCSISTQGHWVLGSALAKAQAGITTGWGMERREKFTALPSCSHLHYPHPVISSPGSTSSLWDAHLT